MSRTVNGLQWVALVLAAVGAVTGGVYSINLYIEFDRKIQIHRENIAAIKALATRRPAVYSPAEWEFIVGWTVNGYANSVAAGSDVPLGRLVEFQNAVARGRDAPAAPPELIDWVWDFYAAAGPAGGRYDRDHRPTAPDRLADAVPGCFGLAVN